MKGLVLAVDDNEAHCYALCRRLEADGFEVRRAATGHEAMDIVGREHPDVVLLDIHLPDLSGFEVCRRIKADPSNGDISIIFHTASWTGGAHHQADEVGASAFLTFPVDPEHLSSVIHGVLARRSGTSAPRP